MIYLYFVGFPHKEFILKVGIHHNIEMYVGHPVWETGGRLNKKDGLNRYGDSHVKDKTS